VSEPLALARISPAAPARPAAAEQVRHSPQQPLEPIARTAHAFSRVRVHAESPADALPAAVEQVRRSSGHPLEPTLRGSMERRFLHDFSRVRVHADGAAAETAAALQARAYTVGPHISFARGAYDPGTDAGKRLVAHELAHVVQQSRTHGWRDGGDAEREASRAADEASVGRRVTPLSATPVRIARQPATASAERELEVEAIEVAGKSYVLYQTMVRTGGSSSWLANNPGNMDYTPDLVEWGAYDGKKLKWGKHRFAIFPNEETGLRAVQRFLRKHQGRRDITLMMNLFAPAGDLGNDPQLYARRVAKALGVPIGTLVQDLTDEQLAVFASTIKEVEGWKEGQTYRRGDPALPEAARG
jgi:Domain of unknown function (DUF4157)